MKIQKERALQMGKEGGLRKVCTPPPLAPPSCNLYNSVFVPFVIDKQRNFSIEIQLLHCEVCGMLYDLCIIFNGCGRGRGQPIQAPFRTMLFFLCPPLHPVTLCRG
jgi:hypothetical protein